MVLVSLAHAGTRVHKDDVLAEFDQQDQLKQFRDSQADYLDFLDKIKKQQADNAADLAKDQTDAAGGGGRISESQIGNAEERGGLAHRCGPQSPDAGAESRPP